MQPSYLKPTTLKKPVTLPALAIISLLLLICSLWPNTANSLLANAQKWVFEYFSWSYILVTVFFLVFSIFVAVSRYGDIRLGPDNAEPEFSFISWASMLFAAGMGIGMMYFGVAEPLQHFVTPPTTTSLSPTKASEAILITIFHFGLHPWSAYAVIGLALAYFGFRHQLPTTIRSGLYPIFGKRIYGALGHSVDTFALVGTIAGIAASLGYGVKQLSTGLYQITGWSTEHYLFQASLIFLLISLAGISAASGISKGIRQLSEINLFLAVLLLCFVMFAGPTAYLFKALIENIGNYLVNLIPLSFLTYTYTPTTEPNWLGHWTIFTWAWWISWSPFVGMFIAQISRGRTIREFIIGVLLVPTVFIVLWITFFGNSAIWIDLHQAAGQLTHIASNADALLFRFFSYFPFSTISAWLAILLITVFFVTSVDSGTYVIDTLASQDASDSPAWQRLLWAAILGMACEILLLTGGLDALRAVALLAALPVAVIMLALCYSLWRGLKTDQATHKLLDDTIPIAKPVNWRHKLAKIVRPTQVSQIQNFLNSTVLAAFNDIAMELKTRNIESHISTTSEAVQLVIPHQKFKEFIYGVRISRKRLPVFLVYHTDRQKNEHNYVSEARTFSQDKQQTGYDIQYLEKEEIIADILKHYEQYLSSVAVNQ